MEFVIQNAFEILSILISAGALLYAALAFRTSKQAIKVARDSDITALHLRAQDSISGAKRSLLKLEEACHQTRREWDNHRTRHFPAFGSDLERSMFSGPEETQHISSIERAGLKTLEELLALTPKPDVSAPSELHQFIARAQSASTHIERLKLGLKGPKPFRH